MQDQSGRGISVATMQKIIPLTIVPVFGEKTKWTGVGC